VATPAGAALNDQSFLAANGIDASKLAPGWKIDGDRVVWPNATLYSRGHGLDLCLPVTEFCLYETDNYNDATVDHNKKVLIWDVDDGVGERVDLATYGFDNIMSSWYNPSGHNVRWWYGFNQTGTSRCMSGRSGKSPRVGLPDNDQASSLTVYPDTSICAYP
jgi:hypothetical protein